MGGFLGKKVRGFVVRIRGAGCTFCTFCFIYLASTFFAHSFGVLNCPLYIERRIVLLTCSIIMMVFV